MADEANIRQKIESVDNDPCKLMEGKIDPVNGKLVRIMILQYETFAVYLDDNLFTYWRVTDQYEWQKQNPGPVLNRAAALEAIPIHHLHASNQSAFRRMVAEGVARMLDKEPVETAMTVLDHAETFVKTRNAEVARGWFLGAGLIAVGTLSVLLGVVGILGTTVDEFLGSGARETALALGLGGVGACVSIFIRISTFPIDPAAGRLLHRLESLARVVTGMAGGLLVLFAIKARLVLPDVQADDVRSWTVLGLCLIAGASERLIPSLIGRLESHTGASPQPSSATLRTSSATTSQPLIPQGSSSVTPTDN